MTFEFPGRSATPVRVVLGTGLAQILHQVVGLNEVGPGPVLDGSQYQSDVQVDLGHGWRFQQHDVAGLGHKGQVGQLLDQPLVD